MRRHEMTAAWHYETPHSAGTISGEGIETEAAVRAELARQHGCKVEDVRVRRAGEAEAP